MWNGRSLVLVHLGCIACAHPQRSQCDPAPAPPFLAVVDTTSSRVIQGVVISGLDSTPIFHARIRIAGTSTAAITDSLGRFRLTAPDTAWVIIVGEGIGYRTNQLRLRLSVGHGWLLRVTLAPILVCETISVWPPPNQRLKLTARGGRVRGNGSILSAAAAGRSLSAIR
jgi:hypothetical protein